MAEPPSLRVDFTQTDDILQILPRLPLRSSLNLGWQGVCVQNHRQPAWETPEYAYASHMILVHGTEQKIQSEQIFSGYKHQNQLDGNHNIVVVPATLSYQANWSQESDFILLFLQPEHLMQVAHEWGTTDRIELLPQAAMSDPLIDQIGRSLAAELEANESGSRLFVESLTTALSVHLLRRYSTWQPSLQEPIGGLPQRKLQQAIAYIQAHLADDLSLMEIANQLDMSQYYFSHLFKQSIGVSPYQYILQQRIERAKFLLRTTALPVATIAQQVGFSTQSQLTVHFRKLTGTTPTHYRKQL